MHELFVSVENNTDPRVLAIKDLSSYDPLIPVTNQSMKIIGPSDTCIYYLPVAQGVTNYYTAYSFGMTNSVCSNFLPTISDGLYEITYSVCPNEEVYITIYHLRVTRTKAEILRKLGSYIDTCETTSTTGNSTPVMDTLYDLLVILDAAVEDVHSKRYSQGKEKLKWVQTKISKL